MGCIKANIKKINNISIKINNYIIDNIIHCNCYNRLHINCSLICTVDKKPFLKVNPDEVAWITEDTSFIYNVISNVNWIVE